MKNCLLMRSKKYSVLRNHKIEELLINSEGQWVVSMVMNSKFQVNFMVRKIATFHLTQTENALKTLSKIITI